LIFNGNTSRVGRRMVWASVARVTHRLGYSRRENPFSPLCFRTGHETFDLIRLLATRAIVIGTLLRTITRPQSLTPALLELDGCPVFSPLARLP